MEPRGLRRISHDCILIPRHQFKIIDLSCGAYIVPLGWGMNCKAFEEELNALLLKYKLCDAPENIPRI